MKHFKTGKWFIVGHVWKSSGDTGALTLKLSPGVTLDWRDEDKAKLIIVRNDHHDDE